MKKSKKKQKQRQPPPNKTKSSKANTLRIIAGQWRGRKLSFATAPGLRPTPDRVREMLFNWLQGHLLGTHVLDLFAGSGALGFEALSRGVKHVTLVEKNPNAAIQLQENIQLLQADQAELVHADAFQYLENSTQIFDLILLDPPFKKGYLPELVNLIEEKKVLASNGLLYIEHAKDDIPEISYQGFELLKEKTTGEVVSKLFVLISG